MMPAVTRLAPLLFAALLVGCVALVGCAAGDPEPAPLGPFRVDDAEAADRIGRVLAADRLGGEQAVVPRLRETTPPGLFDAIAVQTFQVVSGPDRYETFAVTRDEIARLGTGLGGPGVMEFRPSDADADGEPDVAFLYGSGSRQKRYNLGLLDRPGYRPPDPASLDPATLPAPARLRVRDVDFSYRDPVVLRDDAGRLAVVDPARGVTLGVLRSRGGDLAFETADDLPRYVRQRLLSPRR